MRLLVIVLGVISGQLAWGHGVHSAEAVFADGLLHPVTGIDHVLAAVGMGLWLGVQNFSRWSIPLYSGALAAGIVLADFWAVGGQGALEWLPGLTLILAGFLLYRRLKLPQSLVATVSAAVFSCHFYAHIIEMPDAARATGAAPYFSGLVIVTVLLIIAAAAAGRALARRGSPAWLRIAGATLAAAGVAAFGLA